MAINVDSVDGVPLLWVEAPPPFVIALTFRVGQADEQLTNAGISHLVEHLAFPHDHSGDAPSNGTTSLTTTRFYAWGNPENAANFIRQASVNLTHLPTDRIDQQRSIILTEEASNSGGPGSALLTERYGARAHGIVGYLQLGLHKVGPREALDWAAQHYTVDNAILCATGVPPGQLYVDLPRGQKLPAPLAKPLAGPFPRWTPENIGQVGLGVTTGHDSASGAAHRILERRLFKRLRHDLALSYAVQTAGQIVDAHTLHRIVVADSQRETAYEVTRHVVEMAEEFAAGGPTQAEIAEDLEIFERHMADDPRAMGGWMMYAAECYLNGIDVPEWDEYVWERRDLMPAQVRDAWAQAYATAIFVVPPWVEISPERMARRSFNPQPVAEVAGKTFRAPGFGPLRGRAKATLNTEGIAVVGSDGATSSVRFDSVIALIRRGPLVRTLIAVDGSGINVNGGEFDNGAELVALLDRQFPADKIIHLPIRG